MFRLSGPQKGLFRLSRLNFVIIQIFRRKKKHARRGSTLFRYVSFFSTKIFGHVLTLVINGDQVN